MVPRHALTCSAFGFDFEVGAAAAVLLHLCVVFPRLVCERAATRLAFFFLRFLF